MGYTPGIPCIEKDSLDWTISFSTRWRTQTLDSSLALYIIHTCIHYIIYTTLEESALELLDLPHDLVGFQVKQADMLQT